MRIRLSVIAILMFAFATSANAMSVKWSFSNAFFDDDPRTELTGSFHYDSSRILGDAFSNVKVQTSASSGLSGVTYTGVKWFSSGFGFISAASDQVLGIKFHEYIRWNTGPIGVSGGEALMGTETVTYTDWRGRERTKVKDVVLADRHLLSGNIITALMEPASLGIFFLGLLGVVILRRKAII